MTKAIPKSIQRILVAFDNSRRSGITLETAAELAADLQAELHGLFVEDENLLRLADMPFACEIGSTSASARPLNREVIERTFRAKAEEAKQALMENAQRAQVQWAFQVCRGQLFQMTFAAADEADVTIVDPESTLLDRLPYATRRLDRKPASASSLSSRNKSEPTSKLVVIMDGSSCAMRALHIALQLCRNLSFDLIVFLAPSADKGMEELRELARAEIDEQPSSKSFKIEFVSSIDVLTEKLKVGKQRIRLALLNRMNLFADEPPLQLLIHHLQCPLALVR
jgi:K+-sensing histidine kinase KdpD